MIDVYKFLSSKYGKNCSVKLQLYSCRGSTSGVETRGNLYEVSAGTVPYPLLKTLQVRYRIPSTTGMGYGNFR